MRIVRLIVNALMLVASGSQAISQNTGGTSIAPYLTDENGPKYDRDDIISAISLIEPNLSAELDARTDPQTGDINIIELETDNDDVVAKHNKTTIGLNTTAHGFWMTVLAVAHEYRHISRIPPTATATAVDKTTRPRHDPCAHCNHASDHAQDLNNLAIASCKQPPPMSADEFCETWTATRNRGKRLQNKCKYSTGCPSASGDFDSQVTETPCISCE